MDADFFRLFIDTIVRRCSHRNMICLDTLVFKKLLHGDAYRGATAPHADDIVRQLTALQNYLAEPEGVVEEFLGSNKPLCCHCSHSLACLNSAFGEYLSMVITRPKKPHYNSYALHRPDKE